MTREKKKRMMPRHLMTAAVLSGVIPRSLIEERELMPVEELKTLEKHMSPLRPPPAQRAPARAPAGTAPKPRGRPKSAPRPPKPPRRP